MPIHQAMAERANIVFNRENIQKVDEVALAPGTSLRELAEQLGISNDSTDGDYLDTWPKALQESIRSVLESAAKRDISVTICWSPGYDFEVHAWEARSTATSAGAITIHLVSAYPD